MVRHVLVYVCLAHPCFRTNGKVIYASGSPYQPVMHDGVCYEPGQGNNMYIFPGIGLGAILSKTRHISDCMVEQAAVALASSLDPSERAAGLVYPRLTRIRDLSATIALAVIRQAQQEVCGSVCDGRGLTAHRDWTRIVICAHSLTRSCSSSFGTRCGTHRRCSSCPCTMLISSTGRSVNFILDLELSM